MAASLMSRALAAAALVASFGLQSYVGVRAAQPDSAKNVGVLSGSADRIQAFSSSPPKGFTSLTFNDAAWAQASSSPCADPSWPVPEGAGAWVWAGSCGGQNANIALRRTFVVPARDVLSARLWVAIHGGGGVFVNGHSVAVSLGNVVEVDVTNLLRGNGAKNVLAISASQTDVAGGTGIGYGLQLTLSSRQVTAYIRAHPSYGKGQTSGGSGPPQGSKLPSTQSNQPACATAPVPGVVPIFTTQIADKPTATGWVRLSTTQNIYLTTRLVDINSIGSPADMPNVQIGGQVVHATAFAVDDQTGEEVLAVAPSTNLSALAVGQPHNQPVGQVAVVAAYSRVQACLAIYPSRVRGYVQTPDGRRFAQIDLVPFGDGADGGIAKDSAGNLLGVITFDGSIIDSQGRVTPLILPASTVLPNIDYLIGVLTKQRVPTASEHVLTVVTNTDGSQTLARTDGNASGATATPGATSPASTPTATATATK